MSLLTTGVTVSEELENVEQPDEAPATGRRLSRRTMIAGTAGAAAAMWAAPAVTSLAPRAFAQSGLCQGVTVDCSNPAFTPCGSAFGTSCLCFNDECWFPVPFGSGCATDADCGTAEGLPGHCLQACGASLCMLTCAQVNSLRPTAAPLTGPTLPGLLK